MKDCELVLETLCTSDGAAWTVDTPITAACLETLWHPLTALALLNSDSPPFVYCCYPREAPALTWSSSRSSDHGESNRNDDELSPQTHAFNIFSQYYADTEPPRGQSLRASYDGMVEIISSMRNGGEVSYQDSANRVTSVGDLQLSSRRAETCHGCACGHKTEIHNMSSTKFIPSNELLASLSDFSFDLRPVGTLDEMAGLLLHMFQHFNLLSAVGIAADTMEIFLFHSLHAYRRCNSYHTCGHAFDTTQAVFSALMQNEIWKQFNSLELFALLCASVLHDVDHDGRTNQFHLISTSWLSVLYGGESPQENHHASIGYSLLQSHHILDGMAPEERTKFRSLFVDCILATDISRHSIYMDRLSSLTRAGVDWKDDGQRALLAALLVKSADVSNPARPFDIAQMWAEAVQAEFYNQVRQIEIAPNLRLSECLCCRETKSETSHLPYPLIWIEKTLFQFRRPKFDSLILLWSLSLVLLSW